MGIVRATTPFLPVGLEGPVYFVSHGGEAFPSLIVVLQGDGVRVDLTGSTLISKGGHEQHVQDGSRRAGEHV